MKERGEMKNGKGQGTMGMKGQGTVGTKGQGTMGMKEQGTMGRKGQGRKGKQGGKGTRTKVRMWGERGVAAL